MAKKKNKKKVSKSVAVKDQQLGKKKETAREKMIGQSIGYRYDVNLLPDYKKIIPASSKTNVTVNLNDLVLAVRKVSLFVQETNNNVKVSVTNDGKLIVSTDETQIGEGTAEVDVTIDGDNNKIALNAQYILDALSHLSAETISFAVDNKLAPVTIKPVQNGTEYTHIIMPLKL